MKLNNPHRGWFAKQTDEINFCKRSMKESPGWMCKKDKWRGNEFTYGKGKSLWEHKVSISVKSLFCGRIQNILRDPLWFSWVRKAFYFLSDILYHKTMNDTYCLKDTLFSAKMSQASDLYNTVRFSELLRTYPGFNSTVFTVNTGLPQTGLGYNMITLAQRTKKLFVWYVCSVLLIAFQTQNSPPSKKNIGVTEYHICFRTF